jgi:hypothetical protein
MHHGAQSAPYDIFNFTFEMELDIYSVPHPGLPPEGDGAKSSAPDNRSNNAL